MLASQVMETMRILLLLTLLLAPLAHSKAQTAPLACEGRIATVRVSEIKAGGTVDGFMAAMAAHKAWYGAHGMPAEQIFASRVIVSDEKTRAQSYSDKQFLSFHIHAPASRPAQPGPKHDEAYDAFVKLYHDNSDIKSEYNVCMPNLSQQ